MGPWLSTGDELLSWRPDPLQAPCLGVSCTRRACRVSLEPVVVGTGGKSRLWRLAGEGVPPPMPFQFSSSAKKAQPPPPKLSLLLLSSVSRNNTKNHHHDWEPNKSQDVNPDPFSSSATSFSWLTRDCVLKLGGLSSCIWKMGGGGALVPHPPIPTPFSSPGAVRISCSSK